MLNTEKYRKHLYHEFYSYSKHSSFVNVTTVVNVPAQTFSRFVIL